MNRAAMLLGCCSLVACNGTTLVDALSAESALQATQCTVVATDDCFTAFDACKAAQGADLAACREALQTCLPPPPDRAEGGMAGGCQGGRDGEADGGRPRGPRDGDGGGGHHGRPGGPGGERPDSAAGQACRDALDACLAAAPEDESTCFDTAHQCRREAIAADFQARCAEALERCVDSTEDACTRIADRCAAGVMSPPVAEDGTVACE